MFLIFVQKGDMSTTRSLRTGMFPIAEMTGTWPRVDDRLHPLLAGEDGAAVHAHPQEPQIIIRQLLR
jgi:hypothetical protein